MKRKRKDKKILLSKPLNKFSTENLFFILGNTNYMKKIFMIFIFLICTNVYAKEKINYLENLVIENYDISFNKDIYEYEITIGDEKELNIDYELSDEDIYVSITGNGNFNKSQNVITININNDYFYKINVYKTLNVSYIEEIEEVKEMSKLKKEIVKITIITISSSLILGFYYIVFINKNFIKI